MTYLHASLETFERRELFLVELLLQVRGTVLPRLCLLVKRVHARVDWAECERRIVRVRVGSLGVRGSNVGESEGVRE